MIQINPVSLRTDMMVDMQNSSKSLQKMGGSWSTIGGSGGPTSIASKALRLQVTTQAQRGRSGQGDPLELAGFLGTAIRNSTPKTKTTLNLIISYQLSLFDLPIMPVSVPTLRWDGGCLSRVVQVPFFRSFSESSLKGVSGLQNKTCGRLHSIFTSFGIKKYMSIYIYMTHIHFNVKSTSNQSHSHCVPVAVSPSGVLLVCILVAISMDHK